MQCRLKLCNTSRLRGCYHPWAFLPLQTLPSHKSMSTAATRTPLINKDRLWDDIHHVAQWGQGERWGRYVAVELTNG